MNQKLNEYLNKKGFTTDDLVSYKAVIYDTDHFEMKQHEDWLDVKIVFSDKNTEYTVFDVLKSKVDRYKTEGCFSAIFIPLFTLTGDFTGLSIRKMHEEMKHDSWFIPGTRKLDLLFNLNNAFDYAVKKNSIIITEGVYDTMALAKHGFRNTVALLGTNMSYLQFFQLLSIVDNVALCLDNDNAGISAMEKIIKAWPGCMKYYKVDIDKDPDEFLKEHGAVEFKRRIHKWETQ